MQINQINNYPSSKTSFKGYDARQLKGFLVHENFRGIGRDMLEIGKKEGFKVYSFFSKNGSQFCREGVPNINWMGLEWIQDIFTFRNKSLLTNATIREAKAIKEFFGLESINNGIGMTYDMGRKYIAGGNFYIVKNGEQEEALVGANDINNYLEGSNGPTIDEIKQMLNVEKVISVPQIDYHIDLFIRPLDKKRVLLADDEMGLNVLREIKEKIIAKIPTVSDEVLVELNNALLKIDEFLSAQEKEQIVNSESLKTIPSVDAVEKTLKDNDYEVIRVPGNAYNLKFIRSHFDKKYSFNFINANVLKNDRDELVYITNKSSMDEILGLTSNVKEITDGGVEDYFTRAVSKYIKPEHVYFVSGEDDAVSKYMLGKCNGGIHCACAEIV